MYIFVTLNIKECPYNDTSTYVQQVRMYNVWK